MAQSVQALPRIAPGAELILRKPTSLYRDAFIRLTKNKGAVIGIIVVLFFALVAIFAPLIAPHGALQFFPNNSERYAFWVTDPDPQKTGKMEYLLGTDSVGRDVLSRLIYGARTSMVVGFI